MIGHDLYNKIRPYHHDLRYINRFTKVLCTSKISQCILYYRSQKHAMAAVIGEKSDNWGTWKYIWKHLVDRWSFSNFWRSEGLMESSGILCGVYFCGFEGLSGVVGLVCAGGGHGLGEVREGACVGQASQHAGAERWTVQVHGCSVVPLHRITVIALHVRYCCWSCQKIYIAWQISCPREIKVPEKNHRRTTK